jgi:hypothetical protein
VNDNRLEAGGQEDRLTDRKIDPRGREMSLIRIFEKIRFSA